MDGQEYLNQISMQNRPVGKTGMSKLFSSKLFLVSLIGVVLLIIVIIIGVIISSGKGGGSNSLYAFKLHVDNTSELIQKYQPSVKSSDLRSSSASLNSILSNASRDVTNYLKEKLKFKEKEADKKITQAANLARDGLESDLFNAKISGTLDRTYALKMAHEISLIMSEEAKLVNKLGNTDLSKSLTDSYNSLKNLYTKFDDFSEAK